MSVLKSLRVKEKEYIFKSFKNDKAKNPGKAIFFRFPFTDEFFPLASQKNIMESSIIKDFDNTPEGKEQLVKYIIEGMIKNISANVFDYKTFLKECICNFENLEYDDKKIKTVDDFLTLPQSAIETISKELYLYSKAEDEFTFEEKKI
jgi:hypothetical protein